MSREISFFSDYRHMENSLTNYCGLLMKLLYEEAPRKFEELLASLLKTEGDIIVGPKFTQQTKMVNSIPDLTIMQKSFSIFFETKKSDWFYGDQITRHIAGFNSNTETRVLFLLSNFESDDLHSRFESEIAEAKSLNIVLQPLSFEDFVGSFEEIGTSEYLSNLLYEFKSYLDSCGMLPRWKYLLDVVNCIGTLSEIDQGVYMCPDTGRAYSHRRAKYFGPYANKMVSAIFEIKAIVVVSKGLNDAKIMWKNRAVKDEILIEEATTKLQLWEWRIEENKTVPLQVFLLENKEETRFIKETGGGMLQSKKYFWDIAVDCANSKELANKLQDKNWGDF